MKVAITKDLLDSLADKIAEKTGDVTPLTIPEMEQAVNTLAYPPYGTLTVSNNGKYDVAKYKNVDVKTESGTAIKLQTKTITPTKSSQNVTPDATYDGLSSVTVNAIPSSYIQPTGTKSITENGTTDVTNYASVDVNVQSGTTINNQNKTVSPTESQQSVTADSGYTGLGTVTVGAISSTYVGTGITRRSSTDLTRDAYTINVPAGYYAENASRTVERTVHATPTVSINEATGLITAKHTQDQGWVEGSGSGTDSTVKTLQLSTQAAKTITPTESSQTAVAANVYTIGEVTVSAISSTYVGSGITRRSSTDLTASGALITAPSGYYSTAATYTIPSKDLSASNITLSLDSTTGVVSAYASITSAQVGYYGSQTTGNKTLQLTLKDSDDLTVSGATVTVPAGYYSTAASKSINNASLTFSSISNNEPTIASTNNKLTLYANVDVRTYNDSVGGYVASGSEVLGTAQVFLYSDKPFFNDNSGLTVSGATITVPAGYYSSSVSKSVATMTLPTSASSSATSGYTKKATISRSTSTQYINIAPGYNSAGGYYEISAVANGSATGPTSLSGSSATVTTGTNTITLTKTNITTTPTVSAGYVSSATASTATVALTASVTTKAAATITPGTTDQTIASGTYLTGTQTIAGDADLIGSNILSTANIFGVQGTVVIQKYYTGASAPSSSLGNNGDIYLQE